MEDMSRRYINVTLTRQELRFLLKTLHAIDLPTCEHVENGHPKCACERRALNSLITLLAAEEKRLKGGGSLVTREELSRRQEDVRRRLRRSPSPES